MSQIVRSSLPNNILIELLDKVCHKNNNYYIFNNESYKKGNLYNLFDLFIDNIRPYYYNSKQFYLDRNISFKMLTTIIRQICNSKGIVYTNHIKYHKSSHEVHYYIYT